MLSCSAKQPLLQRQTIAFAFCMCFLYKVRVVFIAFYSVSFVCSVQFLWSVVGSISAFVYLLIALLISTGCHARFAFKVFRKGRSTGEVHAVCYLVSHPTIGVQP